MYLLKERPEVEKEEPLVPVDQDADDEETKGLNEGEEGKGADTEAGKAPQAADDDDPKWDDIRPALFDRWLQLKLVLIVLFYMIWIAALVASYYLSLYSGKTGETSYIETFVELTPDEANEFVLCWYLAIFVWGIIINELRIVIISLMAPIRGQALFERQHELWKNLKDAEARNEPLEIAAAIKAERSFQTDFCAKASFATCCLIPPEAVEIALDCIFTMDIVKNGPSYDMKKEDVIAFDEMKKNGGRPKPKAIEMQDMETSSPGKKTKGGKKDKKKTDKGKKTTKGGKTSSRKKKKTKD